MAAALAILSTLCHHLPVVTGAQNSAVDDGREWLDTMPASNAPALLRAAVAATRNEDSVAERLLTPIVRNQAASSSGLRAHVVLSRIYLRRGQYSRLISNLDAWSRSFGGSEELQKEKADVEQFRGLPDQVNGPPQHFTAGHGDANDFTVPVSINGTPATYLLDTGAWMSVMTEQEAKRAGVTIRSASGLLAESSGKGARIRFAVVKDVVIGSKRFQNVSFGILPDVEPWRSMPPGRGGILGIPILLALDCLRWSRGSGWEFGCRAGARSPAARNLAFFENHLLLSVGIGGTRQFLALDTGAETTDLNATYARVFSRDLERDGVKDTTSIGGAAGTAVIQSVTLPQVRVDIAGTDVALRRAHVTMQDNPALGGRCCVGNVGLDLLLHTGTLTIDFSKMTLELR